MAQQWKRSWKSSTKPEKQRKYRENAPYHHQKKFVTATLAEDLRDTVGTRSLPVREGDKAEIMRGDWAGLGGRVERIDYDNHKIYLDGIERERVDTSDAPIALDPSNIKLTKLELDDERRLQKYDVSEEDREAIAAEDEEEEQEAEDVEDTETEEGDTEKADEAEEETEDQDEARASEEEDKEGDN